MPNCQSIQVYHEMLLILSPLPNDALGGAPSRLLDVFGPLQLYVHSREYLDKLRLFFRKSVLREALDILQIIVGESQDLNKI